MTDSTKAQILEVARRAVHTEMLALKHMEETLGDSFAAAVELILACLLYTSPSPRDISGSRMPSSA